MAAALKDIYRGGDAAAGEAALAAFEAGPWGQKYPAIGQTWRRAWAEVIPFYAFAIEVRRLLYTTDEIDKLFLRDPLSFPGTGDRVAKSRVRGYQPGRAAFTVAPHWRHSCAACRSHVAASG